MVVLVFQEKWQRLLTIILILGVTFQGLFCIAFFPLFPYLEKGHPLLEGPAKPNPVELEAIDWVKKHTTIKDYFLTFGEEPSATNYNSKFIIFTGRFAPSFFRDIRVVDIPSQLTPLPEIVLYQKILEECPSGALKTLNYRYLYVNENWPEGLAEKCLAKNDLELKFEAEEGNNFAKIFKVLDN